MEKQSKQLLYTFLYLLALYLGVKMLPLERWISSEPVVLFLSLALEILLILLILYEIRHASLKIEKKTQTISLFLLLPLLPAASSNLLYSLIFRSGISFSIDSLFPLVTLNTLACVVIEELLFRMILLLFFSSLLKEKNRMILSILFTSLCFSLMHGINFFGNNPFAVLLQLGYTLLLGLVLGSLTCLYRSAIVPIVGHFLYNFLNMDLFSRIYDVNMSEPSYILFQTAIGICALIYLVVLFLIDHKKGKNDNG